MNAEKVTYRLKNGQLVTSQQTAVLTEKQLKQQIASKDKELKELINKFRRLQRENIYCY
ncbi:MAG: hypothetical protein U5K51_03520 [Flavobacteriaceae bacterium]|nr:hypothetical protein [Flavobacteriaceae bacterium]